MFGQPYLLFWYEQFLRQPYTVIGIPKKKNNLFGANTNTNRIGYLLSFFKS